MYMLGGFWESTNEFMLCYDSPAHARAAAAHARGVLTFCRAACLHSAAATEAEALEEAIHIAHLSIPKLQKIHPVTSSSSTSKIPPSFPYIIPHLCFLLIPDGTFRPRCQSICTYLTFLHYSSSSPYNYVHNFI